MWKRKWQWNNQYPGKRESWLITSIFIYNGGGRGGENAEDTITGIISAESENDVAIIRNGDGVLGRWQIELSVEQTSLIKIQRVFQIDLFHVFVRGTANTDHVESVSV